MYIEYAKHNRELPRTKRARTMPQRSARASKDDGNKVDTKKGVLVNHNTEKTDVHQHLYERNHITSSKNEEIKRASAIDRACATKMEMYEPMLQRWNLCYKDSPQSRASTEYSGLLNSDAGDTLIYFMVCQQTHPFKLDF